MKKDFKPEPCPACARPSFIVDYRSAMELPKNVDLSHDMDIVIAYPGDVSRIERIVEEIYEKK